MGRIFGRNSVILNPGDRYGRLTVVQEAECTFHEYRGKTIRTRYIDCLCDCGTAATIVLKNLRNGTATSCGCFGAEQRLAATKTHGHCTTDHSGRSPEYTSWRGMLSRCCNPDYPSWYRYGGRGIKVCQHFASDFPNFLEVIGPRPAKDFTVDRKDVNGNYSCGKCEECLTNGWPMNVKWADRFEQQNNRRDNIMATWNGETKTVSEWSRIVGIRASLLGHRIKAGWPPEVALTQPPRKYRKRA